MSLSGQMPLEPVPVPRPSYPWYRKVAAVLFAIFCFELGAFLLVFPWTDYWERNMFATWSPAAQRIWMCPYFRGMISGLGMVNVFLSFFEVVRLRRFAG